MLAQAEQASLKVLAMELAAGMRAFLLELVNAVYGFELRAVFLKELTKLMTLFKARLCIDEVMTAGRTSDSLLLSDALGVKADYISMGKFMTQGVVLERRDLNPQGQVIRGVGDISRSAHPSPEWQKSCRRCKPSSQGRSKELEKGWSLTSKPQRGNLETHPKK